MLEQLLKNIEKHIELSDDEKEEIYASFNFQSACKKEIILRQGQICKKFYFVETGSLRAYNSNANGKESTIMFAVSDWWITDIDGFINQKPSMLSIEALEDCNLIFLDHRKFTELFTKIPKLEHFFRIIFQNAYIREQKRVLQTISLPIEERYNLFLETYPTIFKKISQKQLASYLGITPEFLSSIKKK